MAGWVDTYALRKGLAVAGTGFPPLSSNKTLNFSDSLPAINDPAVPPPTMHLNNNFYLQILTKGLFKVEILTNNKIISCDSWKIQIPF